MILLYLDFLPRPKIFLVLLAVGVLIVVDSSTAIKALCEFKNLNAKYKKKFGFPFIFAVKNKSKLDILASFRKRISYDINTEFEEAKKQVKKIANLRLTEINKNEKNFF